MTEETFASVNGERLTVVRLTVGNFGPWIADVDFEGAPSLSGRVTLKVGALELAGTIVATQSGTHGLQRRARILAGAGGWSEPVAARQYHNDAGVKARLVAEDAARAVGEELGTFVPTAERVGRDYVRQTGPASRALEGVIGSAPWWVDYAGKTNVGPRPSTPLGAKAYRVLAYDPRDQIITLDVPDPSAVKVGSVLTEGLEGPRVVRSFELRVTANELRVLAWVGGTELGHGPITAVMRSIVQRVTDNVLHGHYRYRVVRMAGERVELQAVRKIVGLPDLLPLSFMPGVPGAYPELAPGAEVLVAFIEGDRAQPVVLAFAGKDAPGFVPVRLTLGGAAGSPAARQGDMVEVTLPPAAFVGTVSGAPATGVITFSAPKALGVITGGSTKVRVAT
jgi:hypothetical protein